MGPIDSIGDGAQRLTSARDLAHGGENFASQFTQMMRSVNADQQDAARIAKDLVVDGKGTIHDAVNAMSKAEGSFRLLMEARNRILEGVNQLLQTRL